MGNLGVITGNIENNYVETTTSYYGSQDYGGAISNGGTIEKINSSVIKNNYVSNISGSANGGAINNSGIINEFMVGELSGNYVDGVYVSGGAIYNTGTVNGGTIGEIIGNYAEAGNAPAYGGAIYNASATFKLDAITGDIKNNHATSQSAPAQGGAIYNQGGNLGVITGAIEDNYAKIAGATGAYATGGAIYNQGGTIEELNATTLKNNYVSATLGGSIAQGGAIFNSGKVNGGTIGEISGNYAEAAYAPAQGGAIYNNSGTFELDAITGDIKNNHVSSFVAPAQGGAIYTESGQLGTISGAIVNNYAKSVSYDADGNIIGGSAAEGGAIYNKQGSATGGNITLISGNYVEGVSQQNNTAYPRAAGGAIYNDTTSFKLDSIGDIIGNHASMTSLHGAAFVQGGAIYNSGGDLGKINGAIKDNYVAVTGQNATHDVAGGAIFNNGGGFTGGHITEISGNYAQSTGNTIFGGAIYNTSSSFKVDEIGDIVNNHIEQTTNSYTGMYQHGGAIYNRGGNLGNLNGAIKDNYIIGSSARGGAIYNESGTTTGGVVKEISGNYVKSYGYADGGAIYNTSSNFKLDEIGDIVNNHVEQFEHYGMDSIRGGAIYNSGGNLGKLNGAIKDNYIHSTSGAMGGAIYNTSGGFTGGHVTEISGNYIEGGARELYGGAIYNTSTFKLDSIGDIVNNHASALGTGFVSAQGGAIYNAGGNLGEINGVIKDNYTKGSKTGYSQGGAIYNYNGTVTGGNIGEISGNYSDGTNESAGGAIYNGGSNSTFNANIVGDIVNNHAIGYTDAKGGAIYNEGTFGNIVSKNISNNYAKTEQSFLYGGAIYNKGTLTSLYVKNLTDNYLKREYLDGYTAPSYGGAIYNEGTISEGYIENVANNYIDDRYSYGGAIYNEGTFNAAIGNVVNNYAKATNAPVYGGAIYNSGAMPTLVGNNLSNNYASTEAPPAYGGAIYNTGKIDTISYKKISNNSIANKGYPTSGSYGGAIYNTNTIQNITAGEISSNSAKSQNGDAQGGAIYNGGIVNDDKIGKLSNNSAEGNNTAFGGAIYNSNVFKPIIGSIDNNHVKASNGIAYGGAIYNTGEMSTLTGSISDNYALSESVPPAMGGAIYNGDNGVIEKIDASIIQKNYAKSKDSVAFGGAIYNTGKINEIINSSFLKNYVEAKADATQGGAIWTSKDLDISANNGVSMFKGNYAKADGEKDDNAIYVGNAEANLNLQQLNNGNMYMFDNIRGEDGYKVNISGDSTGTYYMFNDIYNGNVTMANTTVNTVNNEIYVYDFKSLTVNGNTDFVADVDMANQTMDRFTASTYGNHKGKLNVKDMNFVSGSDKDKIEIYFAQKGLKDYVTTSKKEFLTPLYKYGIHYDNREDAGYFVFMRGAGSSNPSDSFNPAVLTSPVATQSGAQASMTNTLYYAFEHGDTFMNFSAMDRFAKINSNTYALAERQGALSTDFNSNLNLDYVHQNKGVWTKPYSSFESIHLKNGPKVDVISYGTLIGFDSDIHKLKRGWSNVATAYIGYNGSQVDYSNVDASTNGGLLGLTETFYKGNFWTALTATAGASFAEAHTMYGKDEMTMLMAGIGSKTGYNFEFKEGKFIVQPRLFMSYSFVNSFDYTNSAGTRIDSDPMHTVQINPSVKFIGNIKGWQPYASVGMVWNLLNETHTEANGVKLPEMHTKPYVEYGVGLQRTWADKFSAYGQAMLRHGGRNGVALTLGFRWALGRDYSRPQKVQKDSKMSTRQDAKRASLLRHSGQDGKMLKRVQHDNSNSPTEMKNVGAKKVLKQLSPTQRQKFANTTTIVNNIYPQKAHLEHTTRTTMRAEVEKI